MKKKILTMVMLAMTAVSMSTGAVFAQTLDSSNAQVSSADKKAPVEEENTFMGKITSVTSNTVTVEVEKMGKEGRPDEKPADGEEPPAKPEGNAPDSTEPPAKPENDTDRPEPVKETKTIKLSASSKIYMITADGEKEISLSDLKEGEMIKITAKDGADLTAETITADKIAYMDSSLLQQKQEDKKNK